MFKHRREEPENVEFQNDCDEVIDIIDIESVSGDVEEESENDKSEMHVNENESINETFHNPSQTINNTVENKFNCEKCDYYAATKSDLVNHKKEAHNWCTFRFSNFIDQDNLKDHILANHTE